MSNGQDPDRKRNPLLPTGAQLADMRRLGLNPHDIVAGPALRAFDSYVKNEPDVGRRYLRHEDAGFQEDLAMASASAGTLMGRPSVSVLGGMVNGLLDLFGAGSEEIQDVGDPSATATVIDPTSADVSRSSLAADGIELTPQEARLRRMKRLMAALSGTLTSPSVIPTHSGIQQDIQLGNLAPAETMDEKVIDEIAILLANIGLFGPLGLGIGTSKAVGGAIGGTAVGGAVTANIPKVAGQILGKTPLRGLAERIAGRTALGVDDVLTRFANVGVDAAFGAGFGVAEVEGHEAVTGHELTMGQKAASIGIMTGAGTALGFLIHGTGGYIAHRKLTQSAAALDGMRVPLVPGDEVAGRLYTVDKNSNTGWKWIEGEKKGKFAKAPDNKALEDAGYEMVTRLNDEMVAAEAADAAIAAGGEVPSPAKAATTPPSMMAEFPDMHTQAAAWYPALENRVNGLMRSRGLNAQEVLAREIEETRALFMNTALTTEQRATAGARLMAMEHMVGEGGATTGSALRIERAALELARAARLRGADWAKREIAVLRSQGDNLVANRFEALMEAGIPQAEHDAIRQMLASAEKRASRGFWEGSRVMLEDGRIVQVMERPVYGMAKGRVLNVGEGADAGLVTVDLATARAVPDAGKRVWLGEDNGGLQYVDRVNPEKGEFIGKDPFTAELKPFKLADIIDVSDSPASAKTFDMMQAEMAAELQGASGDVVPVNPTEAVTPQGEKIIVTGVGQDIVEVQSRGGKKQTLKKSDVRPSRSQQGEIVDYAPGTLPRQDPEKHKLLFTEVPLNQVDAFEGAVGAGTLPQAGLVANTHVLPPTPADNVALYAVELPSRQVPKKMYSKEASNAVRALGGKGTVEGYHSPIAVPAERLQKGQFYRISDDLRASAQRPPEALAAMSAPEQQAYLRHLAVMNEDVWSPVAKAANKGRKARKARNSAVKANNGPEFVASEVAVVEADATALKAALHQTDDVRQAAELAVYDDVIARSDDAPARRAFEELGLTDETVAYWNGQMESLHVNDVGVIPEDQLVLLHRQNPGDRLIVTRRRGPTLREGETGAAPYYEVTAIDQRGGRLWSENYHTTQGVTDQIVEGGYIASLTKLQRGRWIQKGSAPKLIADIYPQAKPGVAAGAEVLARIEKRIELPRGEGRVTPAVRNSMIEAAEAEGAITAAEAQFARKMVSEGVTIDDLNAAQIAGELSGEPVPASLVEGAERVWTSISNKAQDIGSGGIVHRELSRKSFATTAEAEAYLKREGFGRITDISPEMATDMGSPILRFERLPNIDDVVNDPEALLTLSDDVEWIVRAFQTEQRNIPDAVMEYAQRFGKAYQETTGVPLYTREMREILTIPTVEDLSPRMARPSDLQGNNTPQAMLEGFDVVGLNNMPIEPSMHLGSPSPTPKTDAKFIYADVQTTSRVPGEGIIDGAVKMHRQQARQTEWVVSLRKNMGESAEASLQVWSPENKAYGRYRETGQAVEIVDANITGDNVLVRFPGGATAEVAKDAIKQVRHKSFAGDALQFEIAAKVAQGDYSGFVHRTPPMGYGVLEQKLGLLGTNSMGAIRDRSFAHIDNLLSNINFKGGTANAPAEVIEELVETFKRLQQFGAPRTRVSRAGGVRHRVTERKTLFDEALARMPKDQRKPLRYAIEQRVKADFGYTPLGDVIAKAYAGNLTKRQATALREWGNVMLINESVPLGRVAEESLLRTEMHKSAAHIMARFRKDAGFLGIGSNGPDMPYGSLSLSFPKVNDMGTFWSRMFGINHNVAEKHPLSRMVMDAVRAAREGETRRTAGASLVLKELDRFGYVENDLRAIKTLMQNHNTWDDALKAGADEKLAFGYSRFKESFDNSKEDMIRYYLRRDIQPVTLVKSDPRMMAYIERMGYDTDKVVDGALFYMPNPHDMAGASKIAGGATRSKWTADQIEDFVRALREHPNAAALPEGMDADFVSMFDFWKGWGIKNYWPLIHEGNMGIFRELADGTEELLGWASSMPDAVKATRQLAGDGRINFDLDNIRIKETRNTVDDIMLRRVPSKELEKAAVDITKMMDFGPDEVRALFVKSEGYTPNKIKNPYLVNALEREMNLQPVFNDPWTEFMVYNSRVARSHYRMDLIDAAKLMENPGLDRALSEAWGLDQLSKMPNLKKYMVEDVLPQALGERGWAERSSDGYMSFASAMAHRPKYLWDRFFKSGVAGEMDWKTYRQLFNRTYASRKAAGDIIAFQAAYRLWGSPSSAIANATQHWINTVPLLLGDGMGQANALKLGMKSWRDAISLWKANTANEARLLRKQPIKPLSKELQALQDLADESGVVLMPGKHMAGAEGGDWASLANATQVRFGRNKVQRMGDFGKYSGMLMFNGAETVNRFGALAAGYTKATTKLGMDHAPAVQYAKRLIRDTQFYYDDLAMPMMFAKLGPAGRLLFQFKGYMWNQVALETRLAKRAFLQHDANAMKQLTGHLGMYAALGGVRGLASHPLISTGAALVGGAAGVAGISGGFKDPAGTLMNWWRQRRVDRLTPEQAIEGSMPGHYSDIVMHGLPGLLGPTLGQRIGISGQEIGNLVDMTNWATLGPHLSVYGDFYELMKGYNEAAGSGPGMIGAAAGAAASAVLPRSLSRGATLAAGLAFSGGNLAQVTNETRRILADGGSMQQVQDMLKNSGYTDETQDLARFLVYGATKYPTMAAALLGGVLASQGSALDFGTYFNASEEGRAFRQRSLPTAVRGWTNAVEIFANNALLDMDGKRTTLPEGMDMFQEVAAAITNLPTIRREEARAANSYMIHNHQKASGERGRYIEAIGRAFAKGDLDKAYALLADATERGVTIEESSVQREIDARTKEAIDTIRERVLQEVRYRE